MPTPLSCPCPCAGVSGLYSAKSALTLANDLRRVFDAMGVSYTVKRGYVMEVSFTPVTATNTGTAAQTPTHDVSGDANSSVPSAGLMSRSVSDGNSKHTSPANAGRSLVSSFPRPQLSAKKPVKLAHAHSDRHRHRHSHLISPLRHRSLPLSQLSSVHMYVVVPSL